MVGNDGDDSSVDPADALLQRGRYLRQLRQLEQEDEAARAAENTDGQVSCVEEVSTFTLPSGAKVLEYESYLQDQRYYDDLKHIDYRFIDFGMIGRSKLIIEQDKSLGKGGLCWDAAFILGEYLVQNASIWKRAHTCTSVLELGSGTGLCGMLVAKAVDNVHVSLTDLPDLMPLVLRNIARNFEPSHIRMDEVSKDKHNGILHLHEHEREHEHWDDQDLKSSLGTCTLSSFVLDWDGNKYHGTFDVIVGADVVASLYDPVALARTIHATAHTSSMIFVSFKERLSCIHRRFENEMKTLFETLETVKPEGSRNHNPDVQILIARGKK